MFSFKKVRSLIMIVVILWSSLFSGAGFSLIVQAETVGNGALLAEDSLMEIAKSKLAIPNEKDIRGNITLPTELVVNGQTVTITWSSSNPEIITDDATGENGDIPAGVVTRQATNQNVTLTATLEVNEEVSEKVFNTVVKKSVQLDEFKGYIYTYFRANIYGDGESQQIHLASSKDGLFWDDMNNNEPILETNFGTKGVRDSYIVRAPEGDKFYLIATDLDANAGQWWEYANNGSKSIMVWESEDLINWSDQRMIEIAPEGAGNLWAPETIYDPTTGEYVVYWASNVNDEGHRMYYAKTRDFRTFTEPQIFKDRTVSNTFIDTSMIEHDGTYYRFTKKEQDITVLLEKSNSVLGNYELVKERVGGQGGVEGPGIFKLNGEEKWLLMLDGYADTNAGAGFFPLIADSPEDLDSGTFRRLGDTEFRMPTGAKHGSIIPVTQKEYDAIMNKWGHSLVSPVTPDSGDDIKPDLQYKFDEVLQGNAVVNTGVSGAQNNGILHNGASYINDEEKGKVLNLSGGNAGTNSPYLEFPQGYFDGKDHVSIFMDIKSEMANEFFFTFGIGQDTQKYLFLRTRESELYSALTVKSNPKEQKVIEPLSSPIKNSWTNVGIVLERNEDGNHSTMKLYKDGKLVGENTKLIANLSTMGANLQAYLGKAFYNDPFFKGSFDNVRVYNRALTDEQVGTIIDKGNEEPDKPETNFTNTGNPLINGRFSADPATLVHDGKVYLFAGHDSASVGNDYYVMPEWDIYSSSDLENWELEASYPSTLFEWADPDSAWAAQAIERDGKFYWYTTAFNPAETSYNIGVAVSDNPVTGWQDAIGKPLVTSSMTETPPNMGGWRWNNIDPTVYVDDDGQAYLYWGNTYLYYAKLKDNMIELDGEIQRVEIQDMDGSFTEAPWLHKYKDKYYLTFAMNWPEDIGYAMSDSPSGPWTYAGKLMDATEGTGTNHPAMLEFNDKSYFVYHTAALPTGGDYRRSVSIEEIYYNPDGTIKKMQPTASGINGHAQAIQANGDDQFVYHENQGIMVDSLEVKNANNYQWFIVPGLTNNGEEYISIQAENKPGYYITSEGSSIILKKHDGTTQFKEQATFKVVSGLSTNGEKSLQTYKDNQVYLTMKEDQTLGLTTPSSETEKERATFTIKDVSVNDILVNIESEVLKKNTQTVLTATVLPDEALIKGVEFFSSNRDIISISEPYMTPEGETRVILDALESGTAEITMVSEDGDILKTLTLKVEEYDKAPAELKDVDVSFDSTTRKVNIKGILFNQVNKLVTVKVVDPAGSNYLIEQTTTGEDGKFEFNYITTMSDLTGEYLVEIYATDLIKPYQASYSVASTAHYSFNENLNDSTGTFDSGTITGDRINNVGGTISYSDGIVGKAASFDGQSGVLLPNGLINSNRYTVSLWLNPSDLTKYTTTFFGAKSSSSWVSVVPRGDTDRTLVWSGNATWYDADTKVSIPQNEWSHVAFTVDKGDIKVFINGNEMFSGKNFPNVFSNSNSVFGLGVNYWDTPYKGLLDELQIHNNIVLSGAEIKEYYNHVLNPSDGGETPPPGGDTDLTIDPSSNSSVEVEAEKSYTVKGTKVRVTMPSDLPVGTKLKVIPKDVEETTHEGLTSAGDSFTFTFEFPEESSEPTGEFTLSMGYDEEADADKIAIYYFNETTENWEHRGGQVNTENETITLNVPHFSTYAVFVTDETPGGDNGTPG
ncbi:Glycosyl hydrolases family 43, partial [Litchfieldia salsa]